MSKNIGTFKSQSGSVKVDWKWYHSIDWLWSPIYYCSIVTLSIRAPFSTCKRTVTLKPGLWVTLGHQKGHVSIRHLWLPINVLWQWYRPISYRLWDKRRFQSKITNFSHLRVFCAQAYLRGSLGIGIGAWSKVLEWWGYRAENDVWWYLQPSGYNTRTWRTDKWTATGLQQRPC